MSSKEQHPPEALCCIYASGRRRMVMPVTSYPAFNSKRAATELSTPPLIPKRTFLLIVPRHPLPLPRKYPVYLRSLPGLYGKPLRRLHVFPPLGVLPPQLLRHVLH